MTIKFKFMKSDNQLHITFAFLFNLSKLFLKLYYIYEYKILNLLLWGKCEFYLLQMRDKKNLNVEYFICYQ